MLITVQRRRRLPPSQATLGVSMRTMDIYPECQFVCCCIDCNFNSVTCHESCLSYYGQSFATIRIAMSFYTALDFWVLNAQLHIFQLQAYGECFISTMMLLLIISTRLMCLVLVLRLLRDVDVWIQRWDLHIICLKMWSSNLNLSRFTN